MSEKIYLTLEQETLDWLRAEYPEAGSDPERARAAIGDARRFWDRIDVD